MSIFKSSFSLRILSLLTLLLGIFFSAELRASSLEEMDKIVSQASSLEDFLNRPDLQEIYFQAAASYYGPQKFQREPYDAILKQMAQVSKKVNGFSARAWATGNLGAPFTLQSAATSYGRRIDVPAWNDFLSKADQGIEDPLAEMPDEEFQKKIAAASERLKIKMSEADEAIAKLPNKKLQEAERGKLYREISNDAEIKDLGRSAFRRFWQSPAAREKLSSQDPDTILNFLSSLKADPKSQMPGVNELPGPILNALKQHIPDPKPLLAADSRAFPVKMVKIKKADGTEKLVPAEAGRASAFEFKVMPRRFHGFFKGISLGECVGGSCSYLEHLTPERWASSALEGSELHYLERKGEYQGFVQAIPIQSPKGPVMSVDLGSAAFKQGFVEEPAPGKQRSTTLFSAWLRHAEKTKPPSTYGFIIGESNFISNAGALPTARSSAEYILGQEKFTDQQMKHIDPMAAEIVKASPRSTSLQQRYGGAMIFDGAAKGNFTVLRPSESTTAELVRKAVASGDAAFIQKMLSQMYSSSIRGAYDVAYQLKEIGVLTLLADKGYQFKNAKDNYRLFKHADKFGGDQFSWEEIRAARRMLVHTVDEEMAIMKTMVGQAESAAEWMEAITPDVPKMSDAYAAERKKFIRANLDSFLAKKPNLEQLSRYFDEGGSWDYDLAKKVRLRQLEASDDLESVLSRYSKDFSKADEANLAYWVENYAAMAKKANAIPGQEAAKDEAAARLKLIMAKSQQPGTWSKAAALRLQFATDPGKLADYVDFNWKPEHASFSQPFYKQAMPFIEQALTKASPEQAEKLQAMINKGLPMMAEEDFLEYAEKRLAEVKGDKEKRAALAVLLKNRGNSSGASALTKKAFEQVKPLQLDAEAAAAWMARMVYLNVPQGEELTEHLLAKAESADDFLRVFSLPTGLNNPSEAFLKSRNDLIEKHLDQFFRMDPTTEQVSSLLTKSTHPVRSSTALKVQEISLKQVNEPKQIMARLAPWKKEADYLQGHSKLLRQQFSRLLEAGAPAAELHAYAELARDLPTKLALAESALARAQNAQDFATILALDRRAGEAQSAFVGLFHSKEQEFLAKKPSARELAAMKPYMRTLTKLKLGCGNLFGSLHGH